VGSFHHAPGRAALKIAKPGCALRPPMRDLSKGKISMRNGSSLFGLVRELKHEVKIFIREEIRLAKTELGEKISCFGGNSAAVAIGGFVAYAGLIVLLAGLGAVLAFAFSRLDLPPLLAAFIGLSIIGLIVIGAGTIMLMKGIKQLKNQSFAPAGKQGWRDSTERDDTERKAQRSGDRGLCFANRR